MKHLAVLIACASLGVGTPVHAQEQSTENAALAKCVALKSTGQDRLTLGRWFVAAFGSAPQFADIVSVDPAMKKSIDLEFAKVFTRIMVSECNSEVRAFGPMRAGKAFEQAGETLGELAVREVLANPDAAASLEQFADYLKPEDFAPLK